jgi:hypothetical protein
MQAAGQHDAAALDRRIDAHEGFAVGKGVQRQLAPVALQRLRQAGREVGATGKGNDQHEGSRGCG